MRIVDLLAPYADGIATCLDATPGALNVARYLQLDPTTVVTRTRPDDLAAKGLGVGSHGLLVVLAGPREAEHDAIDDALDCLEWLEPGGRALLLLGFEHVDVPVPQILEACTRLRLQVRTVQPLQYVHIRSGAVFERTDTPLPIVPYLQRDEGGRPPADSPATAMRLANERELLDFQLRAVRTHAQVERAQADRAPVEDRAAPVLQQRVDALLAEKQALESAHRKAQDELSLARRRIELIEDSTAYRLGEAAVTAVKHPRSHGLQLPKKVWSLYKGRNRSLATSPRTGAGAGADAQGVALLPGHEDTLFLAHTTAALHPRDHLSIAGVWRETTRLALAPSCTTNSLMPNDATLVLERTSPHLVLIEAAAARAGQPWAFAGTNVALERDRVLGDVMAAARTSGIPVVFWANAPPHEAPGLTSLAALCDLVVGEAGRWGAQVDFDPGLQLRTFNPIALPTRRDGTALYVGALDGEVGAPATQQLHDVLAVARSSLQVYDDGSSSGASTLPPPLQARVRGMMPWWRTPSAYRRAAVVVAGAGGPNVLDAEVETRVWEALACGARVLAVEPRVSAGRAAGVDGLVHGTSDDAILEALDAPARTAASVLATVRAVFPALTVRGRLEALADAVGLSVRPMADCDVAVLVPDPGDVRALVAALALQRHKPSEIIVATTGTVSEAATVFAEVEGLGIAVRVVEVATRGEVVVPVLAQRASAPWVTPWGPPFAYDAHALLDLVIGAECAGADVVATVRGDDVRFVDDLPVDGALVARGVLSANGATPPSPTTWHAEGRRLLGMTGSGTTGPS